MDMQNLEKNIMSLARFQGFIAQIAIEESYGSGKRPSFSEFEFWRADFLSDAHV